MKRNKGAVSIIILIGLVLSNIGTVAWFKTFEAGRNKKVATAAAQQAAAANDQAKLAADQAKAAEEKAAEAKAAAEKLKADIDRERGQRDQIDQNVAGFVEGAKTAVEADPSPSQADLVAIGLLDSAQQANIQKLTPQQREFWKKTVAGLIAKNAEAEAKIRALNEQAKVDLATLTEVRARTDASEKTVITLTNQVKEQNAQLAESSKATAKLTEDAAKTSYEMKVWSDGGQTWQSRCKWALVLCGLITIVGIWLFGKSKKLMELLKDSVAHGAFLKTMATEATKDATLVETKAKEWFEGDTKSAEALKKILSDLRQ